MMEKYLLDTNAFFELLSFLVGKSVRKDEYDFETIRKGECYISKISELEIISVVGKYSRGEPSQWQTCKRTIDEEGNICGNKYYNHGKRPWNKKLSRALLKLVKEVINGESPVFTVKVLDVNERVLERAETFMMYSSRYKFGSQDALIAATAIINSDVYNQEMILVTSDRSLRAAMKEDGIKYIVPGVNTLVN